MRRQDQWLLLADRLELPRMEVVAICVYLNMGRSCREVSRELQLSLYEVEAIANAAQSLLRQPRRETTRRKVRRLGDGQCSYCGTTFDLTIDHVVPRSRRGSDDLSNLRLACRSCNSAKGDRLASEWLQ